MIDAVVRQWAQTDAASAAGWVTGNLTGEAQNRAAATLAGA
jgi:hypothetical protein